MNFVVEKNRKDIERFMGGKRPEVKITNEQSKGVERVNAHFEQGMKRTVDEMMLKRKFNN
jgi:hypothetical protein